MGEPSSVPSLGRGKGPIRKAVRAALAEARDAGRMTLEHEVRAVVAERLAEVADRASSAGDGGGVVRAGDKLLEVLDTLPVRQAPKGGAAGDGGSSGGAVLELFGGGPEMGDTAES